MRTRLPARLARFGTADASLALLVVAVVGLMIVPLPTWLLDILLAANISVSVAVLLVVLYVPDALGIATFPTLLLITTLIRLALNVSSTRLILLQAYAGEVIRAFGNFVVRGNYVVGAVVFLILTIIQFVVIAKGSERVAEVSARFVLDALPGKQMALDAEVRSGAIDGNEARRRRHQLARESQFYGAMDGAMKFVKGDVIASVAITIVNIVGGLIIGVMQKGMETDVALRRYGLLTIGDGLVTQIPALVLSTAAGILVTRVASEEPDTSLGDEMVGQLLSTPKALRNAAVFVIVLAVVPGLPALPFLVIGGVFLALSQARRQRLRDVDAVGDPLELLRVSRRKARRPAFVPSVIAWSIDLSDDLAELIDDVTRGDEIMRAGLRTQTIRIRERVFAELGAPVPAAVVRCRPDLPAQTAVVSIFEVPERRLQLSASDDRETKLERIVRETTAALARRASDFIGIGETQSLLDQLDQVAPALCRHVVPKPISVALLADVLRRLVEEQVSVRDLRLILEALASAPAADRDALSLTEIVRSHLRRATTFRLVGGSGALSAYTLDQEIEETIRGSVQRGSAGGFLALSPGAASDIVSAVRRLRDASPTPEGAPSVLLTQPDIRRFVRKLLETEFPDLHVVSIAEMMPEIAIHPLGRATVRGI